MEKFQIFIYEHIAGGGLAESDAVSSLFPEGFAMLNALVEDFSDLGQEVVTTLDARLKLIQGNIKAKQVVEIAGGEFEDTFDKIIAESDAVLLIAPESDNILCDLTEKVEHAG